MMSLQAALVEHSSPTLAGLKPASLFRYQPEEGGDFAEEFLACRRELEERLAAEENTGRGRISTVGGGQFTVAVAGDGSAADGRQALDAQGRAYRWKGTHKIFDK